MHSSFDTSPRRRLARDGEYLRRVWNRLVYPMAEERGMILRLPTAQPRSRKSLEAAEFARTAGLFDFVHCALFKVFFENGRDLADSDVLADIGYRSVATGTS